MAAQGSDRRVQSGRPALEKGRGVVFRTVQDRQDIFQLQARVAIDADLAQALEILVSVQSIVGARAESGFEQSDRFVVENGAAAEPTAMCELADRQHALLTMNPTPIDRSSELSTTSEIRAHPLPDTLPKRLGVAGFLAVAARI